MKIFRSTMWSRIWRQCTLSLLLVCFIISIKDFNIHAQLIHSFVNIPTSDLYGNNNAPILKALAKVYYSQGFKAIDTNPGFAMEKLISSYKLHPTIYTYEMLRWAYSMIGQATALDDNPNYLPLTDRIRKQRAYFLQQCDFGAQEVSAGNYDRAIEYFESILLFDVDNVANGHSNNEKSAEKIVSLELFEVYFNLAVAYRQLGMAEKAVDYNIHAINLNPIHSKSILNLATIFQQNGALDKAEEWYLRGINVHRAFKQLTNTLGYAFLPDDYLKFSSNLILTYFQMQEFNKAYTLSQEIRHELVEFKTNILSNNPQADTDTLDSFIRFNQGIILLLQRNLLYFADFEELWAGALKATMQNKLQLCTHFQQHFVQPIAQGGNAIDKNAFVLNKLQYGPLLPFDTLSHPIPLHKRLLVAQGTSIHNFLKFFQYQLQSEAIFEQRLQQNIQAHESGNSKLQKKLKIALMSFDFNNHPTTHLIEGLFRLIHTMRQGNSLEAQFYQNIELHVISYGVDDQSYYRQMLIDFADAFHNILAISFEDAMRFIRDELQIDVLLDMQIHTLGHRLEIVAMKPAPIQVNYLVFPGTSGAMFFDYLVADSIVIPVEYACHYSEKLLYLPPTYQISYYNTSKDVFHETVRNILNSEGTLPFKKDMTNLLVHEITATKLALRRQYGLPLNGIIFCNFNKLDKLEPIAVSVWLEIMRSVPNSYLWLLSPSKLHGDEQLPANHSSLQILDNIRNMAKFHGISTNRLIFANRVDKAYHIQRQAAADLFLDTFFYGAHSTATDALRGGLPILTIQGGSFPERVASSLYQSLAEGSSQKSSKERLLENDAWDLDHEALMLQNTLVTFSIKDYISTAILLSKTKQGKKMDVLKSIVWRCVMAERGPFHAVEHNRKLLTSISAMEDEKILNQGILSKLNPTKLNKASNADDQFLFKHSPLFTSNKRWHLVITNV